jgi:hypothetical protein
MSRTPSGERDKNTNPAKHSIAAFRVQRAAGGADDPRRVEAADEKEINTETQRHRDTEKRKDLF